MRRARYRSGTRLPEPCVWIARLPIERSKAIPLPRTTNARGRAVTGVRSRQWKIAVSLAFVGALAAPFAFRTFNAKPMYTISVPLTAQEKEQFLTEIKAARNSEICKHVRDQGSPIIDFTEYHDCHSRPDSLKEELRQGVREAELFDLSKFLAINAAAAGATFVSIFCLAYLIPMLIRGAALVGRRYWRWVNA